MVTNRDILNKIEEQGERISILEGSLGIRNNQPKLVQNLNIDNNLSFFMPLLVLSDSLERTERIFISAICSRVYVLSIILF